MEKIKAMLSHTVKKTVVENIFSYTIITFNLEKQFFYFSGPYFLNHCVYRLETYIIRLQNLLAIWSENFECLAQKLAKLCKIQKGILFYWRTLYYAQCTLHINCAGNNTDS